ncbi:hypothetical protein RFM41_12110 [Mesorhizobium sp. VK25A]|uniref:SMODS and SLOG-associating 2TM effector domain-containing protein n=1 Tax=Mesorhizobium vachelliae TaxID=3072309 RepID=A0ABU4ZXG9_9HYPH|nr:MULTISPECIES: hypothetical protein [unclassified Mesorhizobium]MDX8530087.1 hypothetical protein [Mesorhizobium sp. VK25D]MDX8544485.1 hypothetical protein [Mesorhizobium sp. VK25A]
MKHADLKIVMDDVRARDAALLNLIIFTDRQAMALFRVYVTVGAATAVAAASGFLGVDPLLHFAGPSTAAIALTLGLACYFCLRAMTPADIGLPGRPAEFWQWTADDRVQVEDVIGHYLSQAKAVQDQNRKTNEEGARALAWAKRLGIIAPTTGLLIGAIRLAVTGI